MLRIKSGESIPQHTVIPTPSFGLNHVLGGGLWSGRIHVMWGNPQAGKSTFILHTMAEAEALGYKPIIIDAEGSMTDEWIARCGVSMDREVWRGVRAEDIGKELFPMLREKHSKYFVLVDSINSVVLEQFFKKDDSAGGIGIYARTQTYMCEKIMDALLESPDHIVVFIAQQTIADKGGHMVLQGKFGNAVNHHATNIVRLSAYDGSDFTEREKDTEAITNQKVTWQISKSKQGPVRGTKGHYWFNPLVAQINKRQEIADIAVRNGVIEKRGAWFYYGEEKYHGLAALTEALTDEDEQDILHTLLAAEIEFESDDEV